MLFLSLLDFFKRKSHCGISSVPTCPFQLFGRFTENFPELHDGRLMGLFHLLELFFLGGPLLGQHPEVVPGLLELFLETGGLLVKGFLVCLQGCAGLAKASGFLLEISILALELFSFLREFSFPLCL